ncbi:MAG: hypothetical protein ACRDI3_03690 [Actinomycetota bacterium]
MRRLEGGHPLRHASRHRRAYEEERLIELQMWAVSCSASAWLIDVEPYEPCRVAGVVQGLRLDPRAGYLEATIADGTGLIVARWQISRPLPQLAAVPGTGLVLEGVPVVGADGEMVMAEPSFETVPFPDRS